MVEGMIRQVKIFVGCDIEKDVNEFLQQISPNMVVRVCFSSSELDLSVLVEYLTFKE